MFVIGIALIILLILWIGPQNLINTFKTVNLKWIFVALLIHLLAVGVRSFRWGFIIKKPFEFKNNYVVKVIGLFAGNFSPMRTAGEVINAVAGKKINKIKLSEGLSAGLTERFFDLVIVVLLLVLASIWVENTRYLSILGATLTIFVISLIYLVNWREDTSIWLYEKIHPFLCKLPIDAKLLDNMHFKFRDGLKRMTGYTNSFTTSGNLIFVAILSIFAWILECFRLYIVFYAFNIEISFVAVIIIFLIANIIGVLSALPGGMGSIEVTITGLLVVFGVPEAFAGSIALADRLVSFWAVTVLGIIFSAYYARDILGEVKKYTLDLKLSK